MSCQLDVHHELMFQNQIFDNNNGSLPKAWGLKNVIGRMSKLPLCWWMDNLSGLKATFEVNVHILSLFPGPVGDLKRTTREKATFPFNN
jgi:hypothetical protein